MYSNSKSDLVEENSVADEFEHTLDGEDRRKKVVKVTQSLKNKNSKGTVSVQVPNHKKPKLAHGF